MNRISFIPKGTKGFFKPNEITCLEEHNQLHTVLGHSQNNKYVCS
jgi:hypothetical protein